MLCYMESFILEQADSQICICTLRWDGHENWSDLRPNQDK